MKAGPWEEKAGGVDDGGPWGTYIRHPAGATRGIIAGAWGCDDIWSCSAYPPGCKDDVRGPCRRDEGTFTTREAAMAWADAQLRDMGWELEGEQ